MHQTFVHQRSLLRRAPWLQRRVGSRVREVLTLLPMLRIESMPRLAEHLHEMVDELAQDLLVHALQSVNLSQGLDLSVEDA